MLNRSAVLQVSRDSRCPERMRRNLRRDACLFRSLLDHCPRIQAPQDLLRRSTNQDNIHRRSLGQERQLRLQLRWSLDRNRNGFDQRRQSDQHDQRHQHAELSRLRWNQEPELRLESTPDAGQLRRQATATATAFTRSYSYDNWGNLKGVTSTGAGETGKLQLELRDQRQRSAFHQSHQQCGVQLQQFT